MVSPRPEHYSLLAHGISHVGETGLSKSERGRKEEEGCVPERDGGREGGWKEEGCIASCTGREVTYSVQNVHVCHGRAVTWQR